MTTLWHAVTVDDSLAALQSGPGGLDSENAQRLLQELGPNQLASPARPSLLWLFLSKFKEYLVIVLIFAAIISFVAGEIANAYVILAIVFLVAIIGFLQEYKAQRAMEALRDMQAPEADVFRDGKMASLPASDLVPGDVIFLEAGDKVPADGRIIEETGFEVIEAALTGESLPIRKSIGPLPDATPLADRKNMVFMGTFVSYGNCRAVITATGSGTELGKISRMISENPSEPPLKIKLDHLAKRQAILVLAISVAVFVLAVARGSPIMETLITAIALAVAGVPEALPFVVTLALAFGTQRMARRNAIIRSLPAVETLGSITVICTDKTGTLTSGEMTLREIRTYRSVQVTGEGYEPVGEFIEAGRAVDMRNKAENCDVDQFLKIAVLCNNADLSQDDGKSRIVGDPTEAALLVAAKKAGAFEEIRNEYVEVVEYPFDSDRKRMTTVHRSGREGLIAAMKGAPENVLPMCTSIMDSQGIRPITEEDRRAVLQAADDMAERAMRTLAFAWKDMEEQEPREIEWVESCLTFAGLSGMMDPPRKEAKDAIRVCLGAGIRPIMITGDHPLTAKAIGAELGIGQGDAVTGAQLEGMSDEELQSRIGEASIFARVTAEHKVRIVLALKSRGNIVAMTGDGVNDAPALKAADIGVAMGRTGTEVAKEASDMIIADDNFATIVRAVEEGRRIYDNIRKGASYLLSVSFAELAVIFLGVLLGFPVPLLAVQILWINVIAEEFPAIGLAIEPAHAGIMNKKPRDPAESMPSRGLLIYTLGISGAIVIGTLGLYALSLDAGEDLVYARTVAFMSLGLLTVCNAYCSRSLDESVLKMNPLGNKKLILGMAASVMALLAVVYVPFMQSVFGTTALVLHSWVLILAASLVVVIASEILKRTVPELSN
ncbi:MAG: HAD family hydrolase [Methanothrix sp.]|nr:MAG: HAD family hydrolase [Methanothrix sp.]